MDEIDKFVTDSQLDVEVVKTQAFVSHAYPLLSKLQIHKLRLELRDYQSDIVRKCFNNGRGVVVLATAGGKTLTIATLLEAMYQRDHQFKCALIVPDLGLVSQTVKDFIDYGASFSFCKWTGKDELDLSKNVIICNLGILQSSKSNIEWISGIDMCIVDEVHKLRKGNKINKLFRQVRTNNIFGFTGTMPEDLIDQWNIIGKIGPIIYEKNSYGLRKDKYIADVKVQILKLQYLSRPKYPTTIINPSERYRAELDFLIHNSFRNNIISNLCDRVERNTLILVDYIDHGNTLHQHLSSECKNKKVYFIRGEVDVSDRDRIKELMEMNDNIIVVAISKIFSTGVNIKNLHYIIFGGGGKAKIKTVQSIGRGLRLHKNKEKLIIFDIGDDLQYGSQHLVKRLKYYEGENIEYGIQEIKEKDSE